MRCLYSLLAVFLLVGIGVDARVLHAEETAPVVDEINRMSYDEKLNFANLVIADMNRSSAAVSLELVAAEKSGRDDLARCIEPHLVLIRVIVDVAENAKAELINEARPGGSSGESAMAIHATRKIKLALSQVNVHREASAQCIGQDSQKGTTTITSTGEGLSATDEVASEPLEFDEAPPSMSPFE